ncbi:methylenomycin A resistance protein [Bacillus mycoides]|nr:methylenomycin A resistance protein [Bacillus mycoides]
MNLSICATVPVMTAIVMQAAGPAYANMDGATLNVN